MTSKANKTLIGVFVAGSVAIILVGIVVVGSGHFWKKTSKYVLFFEGSIKGLNVGAPVVFRGVKVGSVSDIILRYDPRDLSVQIPVIVDIEPWRFSAAGQSTPDTKTCEALIAKGLRARLDLVSFVTGQLLVSLDFYKDNVRFRPHSTVMDEYPEIPTVPSPIEEFSKSILELPVQDLVSKIDRILQGLNVLVNSEDLQESLKSVNLTLKETRESLGMQFTEFSEMTTEVTGAARSLRLLVDYLERNPEALLKGKGHDKGVAR